MKKICNLIFNKKNKYKKLKIHIDNYDDIDLYLSKICINIYNLIKNYCNYYNCNFQNMKNSILHNDNITIKGMVRPCDINDVCINGNIREKMTLIYLFGVNGSKIISSLLLDDYFVSYIKSCNNSKINNHRLYKRFIRLTKSIGLTSKKDIIKLYNHELFTDYDTNNNSLELLLSYSNKLPCLFASLIKEGCAANSKNTDFPFNKDAGRIFINDNNFYNQNLYNKNDIYPSLSNRELSWFNQKNLINTIPWKCGSQYYKISPDSIYKKFADIYNQKTISGISGTTDLVLDIMSLFSCFNLHKSLHANLIWQCSGNNKDHSIYEILVASIPYGLNYTININAELFLHQNNINIPLYYEYPFYK